MVGAVRALLDLVLPTLCAGCGATDSPWCGRCRGLLGPPRPVHAPELTAGPPAYALAGYSGPVRAALLGFKERGRRDLATGLGEALAQALVELPDPTLAPSLGEPWWLVPVPSRASAAARRGGQHVEALANRAAAHLAGRGHPAAVAPALRMARGARDSVGLSPAARRENVAGRVRTRPAGAPPSGSGVVLVDDLVTTGATAAACSKELLRSGVRVVAVVTLAATTLRS